MDEGAAHQGKHGVGGILVAWNWGAGDLELGTHTCSLRVSGGHWGAGLTWAHDPATLGKAWRRSTGLLGPHCPLTHTVTLRAVLLPSLQFTECPSS